MNPLVIQILAGLAVTYFVLPAGMVPQVDQRTMASISSFFSNISWEKMLPWKSTPKSRWSSAQDMFKRITSRPTRWSSFLAFGSRSKGISLKSIMALFSTKTSKRSWGAYEYGLMALAFIALTALVYVFVSRTDRSKAITDSSKNAFSSLAAMARRATKTQVSEQIDRTMKSAIELQEMCANLQKTNKLMEAKMESLSSNVNDLNKTADGLNEFRRECESFMSEIRAAGEDSS